MSCNKAKAAVTTCSIAVKFPKHTHDVDMKDSLENSQTTKCIFSMIVKCYANLQMKKFRAASVQFTLLV